ncbi:MAG: hypothetical protein ABIH67_04590 [Candidatus Uhrbacteria bacterium]
MPWFIDDDHYEYAYEEYPFDEQGRLRKDVRRMPAEECIFGKGKGGWHLPEKGPEQRLEKYEEILLVICLLLTTSAFLIVVALVEFLLFVCLHTILSTL